MEFEDDAFVLSARAHGETGAIVDLLTSEHGRYAAHVAGGASRRLKPFLQPGAQVRVRFRARVAEQLGAATLEPIGEGPGALFDDPLALHGLSAAAAVAAGALPEREPHHGAYLALEALIRALAVPDIWPAVFVRFEAGLLQDLGFGLDLSKCAATGVLDNLIYVSPRTGRAVSAEAGEPYKDKLLHLPPFLLSAQGGIAPGDIRAGLDLTAHFLQAFVFNPLNRPLPQARLWLVDRLSDADRL
ncbi:MAG: DNA repair protein RecO [Phenylobacterium sp.]|uniref:DNA repair protein RecO n=1 Tax=Phenylobacterium sp. TaxID=1871053 RepID=UPI00272F64F5|nr:DNA repair protein RecO [Phenylobacterium sp.]MDP2008547.1 DNA repair protein RecO [Phenylobacterium sp.]